MMKLNEMLSIVLVGFIILNAIAIMSLMNDLNQTNISTIYGSLYYIIGLSILNVILHFADYMYDIKRKKDELEDAMNVPKWKVNHEKPYNHR